MVVRKSAGICKIFGVGAVWGSAVVEEGSSGLGGIKIAVTRAFGQLTIGRTVRPTG